MTCFEIGFKNGDFWSVNLVEVSDTNDEVESAITVTRYAADKAQRHGYDDYYVSKRALAAWQIEERKAKGMPLVTIQPI